MNASLIGCDLCGGKISIITRDEKGDVSGVAETNFWALRLTALVLPRNFS
jgi:hypothetical protein